MPGLTEILFFLETANRFFPISSNSGTAPWGTGFFGLASSNAVSTAQQGNAQDNFLVRVGSNDQYVPPFYVLVIADKVSLIPTDVNDTVGHRLMFAVKSEVLPGMRVNP